MTGFHPLYDIEGKKPEIIGFLENFFGNMFYEATPEDYDVISRCLDTLAENTKDDRRGRTFSALVALLPEGELRDEVRLLSEGRYSFCDGRMDDVRKWTFEGFDSVALCLVDYYSSRLAN